MAMFTSKEQKNLVKLLNSATDQDRVMTLDELHGYIYGLALIPELLMPSQWLHKIFGGEEMCEIDDEKEGERLIGSLFSAYNRINEESRNRKFVFPFDVKNDGPDNIIRIRKWCRGLYQVLSNSGKLIKHYERARNKRDESRTDTETFAVSYSILHAVAFPENTSELRRQIQKGVDSDVSRVITDANFISMLPDAVADIHKFAIAAQDTIRKSENQPFSDTPSAPLRVEKIGRNDPCPCGSGIKFKKCCGK